jgi:hypothetical protein
MNDLKVLLQRYAMIGVSERKKKEVVAKVLQDHYSVSIKPAQVLLQGSEVRLNIPASLRYAVHQEKKDLLRLIAKELNSPKEVTELR